MTIYCRGCGSELVIHESGWVNHYNQSTGDLDYRELKALLRCPNYVNSYSSGLLFSTRHDAVTTSRINGEEVKITSTVAM